MRMVRPWAVLWVQLCEMLRGLWHLSQQETYTNAVAFKRPLGWLIWKIEYLCIIRIPVDGKPVVVYMKPGAERQVGEMQGRWNAEREKILNIIGR